MSRSKNIFLVGPMGAGKTTIGRQLAKALHLSFVDSDREIELRTGVSIALIFELEGEAGFRRREQTIIAELVTAQGIILATGGGAILDPANRANLSSHGYVIYLYAELPQLLERTARDNKRPLLQTEDPAARLREILAVRDPLYREIADMIINTGGLSVRAAIKAITGQLEAEAVLKD
ncbi:MAG: shikimate kinase I [Gammaproteobacteria bacterium RBG_16_57_12]|nr:MAG: shikimate kinase I [Gammaproteobacteria bacterium RBG_16_57_12]